MKFEYPILVALATVGMMVMVSSGDLLTLYLWASNCSRCGALRFGRVSPRQPEKRPKRA
jgi:hypothetical protein